MSVGLSRGQGHSMLCSALPHIPHLTSVSPEGQNDQGESPAECVFLISCLVCTHAKPVKKQEGLPWPKTCMFSWDVAQGYI